MSFTLAQVTNINPADDSVEKVTYTDIPTTDDGSHFYAFATPKRFVEVYNHDAYSSLLVDYRCSAGGATYYPSDRFTVPPGAKLILEGKAITLIRVKSAAFPVSRCVIVGGN